MNNKNYIHRKIYTDCIRATTVPILLYGLQECLEGILTVLTADILGRFADAVFRLDFAFGMNNLWKLLICIGITVLLVPFINVFSNIFMVKYSIQHERMVLGRFLDKDYSSVLLLDDGDFQNRLEWESCDLRCGFVDIITDAVRVVITSVYLLYCALAVSPLYTVIVFAISIIKLTVPVTVRKLEKKYDMQTREYQSQVRTYEEEFTRQPHVVKLYGISDALIERLDSAYRRYFKDVHTKNIRCVRVADGIASFLETFCVFAVLFTGVVLTTNGNITPGTVAAMVGYFGVFGTVIGKTGGIIRTFPKMQNNVQRMEVFYENKERTDGMEIENIRTMQAENLSFTYNQEERYTFKEVKFTADPVSKIAVCGHNGSGKSTLIHVMCGLLNPYEGSLKFEGVELSDISPKILRDKISYVSQDPYLFAGTVRDNVRLGRLSASDTEVDEIIKTLGIEHLADRMVSSAMESVSGGEKQRISLARALLKNTSLIFMDEPSNNLDAQTIKWLKKFLSETDIGVIYITHDLDMQSCADTVIQL